MQIQMTNKEITNNNGYDFIIVGQGIAGTLLGYFLMKQGKSVIFIDDHHQTSSSKYAAGIINPVTGRKFLASWRIEELLPFAATTYDEIALFLKEKVAYSVNMLRVIDNAEGENNWIARTADPKVGQYMCESSDEEDLIAVMNPVFARGELKGTMRVDLPKIISLYRIYLEYSVQLFTDLFDYNQLNLYDGHVEYKGIKAKEIVFCEGYKIAQNPFFAEVKMAPTKGELLHVRIPGLQMERMYKDNVFIVKLSGGLYWVGGGYERNASGDLPSEERRGELILELDRILKVPYEVVGHFAAIRPTIATRRPHLATSQNHNLVHAFNGLGTKGASLGPFFANNFAQYLVTKNPRFLNLES